MGNVKELAQKGAMEKIDQICDKLINGIINRDDAIKAIKKVTNVELVIDRNNIDDHVDECLNKNKDVPQSPENLEDEDDDFIKEFERIRN